MIRSLAAAAALIFAGSLAMAGPASASPRHHHFEPGHHVRVLVQYTSIFSTPTSKNF